MYLLSMLMSTSLSFSTRFFFQHKCIDMPGLIIGVCDICLHYCTVDNALHSGILQVKIKAVQGIVNFFLM